MGLVFEKKDVRLVSVKPITTQKGKSMTFVRLADKATFASQEFALARDHSMDGVIPGVDYDMVLDVDGDYSSVWLAPVKAPPGKQ